MTAEAFAANFRSEMGRLGWVEENVVVRLLSPSKGPPFGPYFTDALIRLRRVLRRVPTAREIEVIAAALGCPVERLTISREELERRLALSDHCLQQCEELVDAQAQHRDELMAELVDLKLRLHTSEHVSLTLAEEAGQNSALRGKLIDSNELTDRLRGEIAELERRLAFAEAACADVSWECPGCAAAREVKP